MGCVTLFLFPLSIIELYHVLSLSKSHVVMMMHTVL